MKKTLKDLQSEKRKLLVDFDRVCSLTKGADIKAQRIMTLIRYKDREIAKMEGRKS